MATKGMQKTSPQEFADFDKAFTRHWTRLLYITLGSFFVIFILFFLLSYTAPDGLVKDFLINLSAGFYGSAMTFGILTVFEQRRRKYDDLLAWRTHQTRLNFLVKNLAQSYSRQLNYTGRAKRLMIYAARKSNQSPDPELVSIVRSLFRLALSELDRSDEQLVELALINQEMYQTVVRFNDASVFEFWQRVNDIHKRMVSNFSEAKKATKAYAKLMRAWSELDGSDVKAEELAQKLDEWVNWYNEAKRKGRLENEEL